MSPELCSVIVVAKDRFSTTESSLENILANTPEPFDLIVVSGGTPERSADSLRRRFGARVKLLLEPRFLNPSEARNIGMRAAGTRLAVLMDNDTHVRPGWLSAMVRCQNETGAVMVTPLILENSDKIHTAGNDLFITSRGGVKWGQKVLRYHKMTYYEGSNLTRQPTEYGELHCQLVEVATTLKTGAFDEKLREGAEVDSGLTWAKAGRRMFFEPGAVVDYKVPDRIVRAEDIRPFIFKWDMDEIRKSYDHFREKWGIDITECGNWIRFNVMLNNKLGLASRLFPSEAALAVDNGYMRLKKTLRSPGDAWRGFKAKLFGAERWTARKD